MGNRPRSPEDARGRGRSRCAGDVSHRSRQIQDAAKDLITDYRVNGKRTLVDVTYRVDHILGPWFNGRRLSSITTSDIRDYIKHRLEQGARRTRASTWSSPT
jgi:hypothetical protein